MPKPAQKTARTKTQHMLKEMPLQELRQAQHMSQERLPGGDLHINQFKDI